MITLDGPDWHFQRLYTLAYLRGGLMQVAHDRAEQLRTDAIDVSRDNLRTALILVVGNAHPRSSLIPWDITDDAAEQMIEVVVADYLREEVSP